MKGEKMNIIKNIKVPTGNICIAEGEKGKIEFLSIGDYGKEANVKADFLGLNKEINGVAHSKLLPLEEKWVITISSQYGCSMGCTFCDVPKVGRGLNASKNDMVNQVLSGISLHPEVKHTDRLNVHYARMGEPTWNQEALAATFELNDILKEKNFGFHPVISTMMPKDNVNLRHFLESWIKIKNETLNGEAGLQLSINTTDNIARKESMSYNTLSLLEISNMIHGIVAEHGVVGRKIALNFALTDAEIDENKLRRMFDPKYFMCKITPMHMTNACEDNDIVTADGYESYYPYKDVEERLKSVGFDVLVFVPSKEEDDNRITCGNAILSGSEISTR
jgi:23S rRNA (adenine2503-C2)-methyltransferase